MSVTSTTVGRRLNCLRASRGLPPVDVHEMLRDRQVLVDVQQALLDAGGVRRPADLIERAASARPFG